MILQSHQIPHACTAEYESALRLCKRPLVQMHAASFSSRSESSPPMLEFQTLAACILTYIRSPTTASAAMANDCKYMTALFYVRIIGSGASSALPAMTLLDTLRISLYNSKTLHYDLLFFPFEIIISMRMAMYTRMMFAYQVEILTTS